MKLLEDIKIKPASWIRAGVYALVVVLLYYSALKWLIFHDWYMEEFSHCVLVPFIILYLLWEKRKDLAATLLAPSWWGAVPFCVGMVFYWLGELGGEFFTIYISLWLVIVGIVWINLGLPKLKKLWFVFVMMLAMFPPPNFVIVRATAGLKLISSQFGVWMLHLWGVSAYREGNVIDIGFTRLQVVDACSGLNYVAPLAVLGLLFAYWFRAHPWKRIILFLTAVPLAIFVNSFRIAMTGVLYSLVGQRIAEGFFHLFSGWLIFLFAIPLFLIEMFVLRMIPQKETGRKLKVANHTKKETIPPRPATPDTIKGEVHADKNEETAKTRWGSEIFRTHFLVTIAALLCMSTLSYGVDFRGNIPARRSFDQFPMMVGDWRGARDIMDQRFIDTLRFSDYITANYYDRQGKVVNLYVAYYRDQRKGESIHSPATCLPGSGWEFHQSGIRIIPGVTGMPAIRVNRAFMEKEGRAEIVYYWFPMRGRVATQLYQIKLYNFWDALTKHRTDGALVRVITPVYPAEHPRDTELRLQRFVADIRPVLNGFLPE